MNIVTRTRLPTSITSYMPETFSQIFSYSPLIKPYKWIHINKENKAQSSLETWFFGQQGDWDTAILTQAWGILIACLRCLLWNLVHFMKVDFQTMSSLREWFPSCLCSRPLFFTMPTVSAIPTLPQRVNLKKLRRLEQQFVLLLVCGTSEVKPGAGPSGMCLLSNRLPGTRGGKLRASVRFLLQKPALVSRPLEFTPEKAWAASIDLRSQNGVAHMFCMINPKHTPSLLWPGFVANIFMCDWESSHCTWRDRLGNFHR